MSAPEEFRSTIVNTSAGIRITGSEQEIHLVLNALSNAGIFYKTNRKLYPSRDNPHRLNLYLNWLKVPAVLKKWEPEEDVNF